MLLGKVDPGSKAHVDQIHARKVIPTEFIAISTNPFLIFGRRAIEYRTPQPSAKRAADQFDGEAEPMVKVGVLEGTAHKADISTGAHLHPSSIKAAVNEYGLLATGPKLCVFDARAVKPTSLQMRPDDAKLKHIAPRKMFSAQSRVIEDDAFVLGDIGSADCSRSDSQCSPDPEIRPRME